MPEIDPGYVLNWSLAEQSFFNKRAKNTPIDRLAITDHMNILEVGCGLGGIIMRIAAAHPAAMLTGVDSSQAIITEAQRLADGQQLKNARFIQADAHALPFTSREFDLCFFQTVLMHLADPYEALTNMVDVTRNGGRITALAEGDWSGVTSHPTCSALDEMIRLFLQAMVQRGGDPFIGGRLASLFEQLDVRDIEVFENADSGETISGKDLIENGYLAIAESFLANLPPGMDKDYITGLIRQTEDWCHYAESSLVMPRSFGATAIKNH
jgi:ubiquinone/menaquinone biosynthesis C-methylase UbiE